MKHRFALILMLVASAGYITLADAGMGKGYHHGGGMGAYNAHYGDIDTDGDDAVTFDEFKSHFDNKQKAVFDAIDTDKNGTIGHDEWHAFKSAHGMGGRHGMTRYHSTELPDPAPYMVPMRDIDGNADNAISTDEFKTKFPDAEAGVFEAIDLDKNGSVSRDEWHQFKSAHGCGKGYHAKRNCSEDCPRYKDCPYAKKPTQQ